MADSSSSDHQLVFVGGLHRSGTSLLAQLIADHPSASGLSGTGVPEDEGQHVQSVYPPGGTYGGPGRFARKPAAHLTETSPLATPQNAQRLLSEWEPHWDLSKPVLVEKSPPNLIMGRFLQELFPTASLLFIVRHPVAVTLATLKWRPRTSLPRLMEHWFHAHEIAREDLPALRRIQVVSYEHLMRDPTGTLSGVQEYLGLASPIPADRIQGTHSDSYQRAWQEMLDDDDRSVRACIRRFEDDARSYGYDLRDLTVCRSDPLTPLA